MQSLIRGLHSHLVPVYSAELGESVAAGDIEYGPTQGIQVFLNTVILGIASHDLCNTHDVP